MTRARSNRGAILIGALIAGTALGCRDALPTQPSVATRLAISDDLAAAFRVALDDARARALLAVGREASRGPLGSSLDAVTSAIATRDRSALEAAITAADAALAEYPAPDELGAGIDSTSTRGSGADQADLDVVRLVLEQARRLTASNDKGIPR